MFTFLSKGSVLIGLTAMYLVFAAGLFPSYSKKMYNAAKNQNPAIEKADLQPLDLRTQYTKTEVDDFFSALGPEGQAYYHFVESKIDMAYPIVYTLFFMSLMAFLLRKNEWDTSNLKMLLLLPLMASIPDYFENFNILKMLELGASDALATRGSLFSSMKWGGVLLCLLAILILALGLVFRKIKTRK